MKTKMAIPARHSRGLGGHEGSSGDGETVTLMDAIVWERSATPRRSFPLIDSNGWERTGCRSETRGTICARAEEVLSSPRLSGLQRPEFILKGGAVNKHSPTRTV